MLINLDTTEYHEMDLGIFGKNQNKIDKSRIFRSKILIKNLLKTQQKI